MNVMNIKRIWKF